MPIRSPLYINAGSAVTRASLLYLKWENNNEIEAVVIVLFGTENIYLRQWILGSSGDGKQVSTTSWYWCTYPWNLYWFRCKRWIYASWEDNRVTSRRRDLYGCWEHFPGRVSKSNRHKNSSHYNYIELNWKGWKRSGKIGKAEIERENKKEKMFKTKKVTWKFACRKKYGVRGKKEFGWNTHICSCF